MRLTPAQQPTGVAPHAARPIDGWFFHPLKWKYRRPAIGHTPKNDDGRLNRGKLQKKNKGAGTQQQVHSVVPYRCNYATIRFFGVHIGSKKEKEKIQKKKKRKYLWLNAGRAPLWSSVCADTKRKPVHLEEWPTIFHSANRFFLPLLFLRHSMQSVAALCT